MTFLDGIRYNFRGLLLGLKTPKLLMLGLLRFVVILLLAIGAAVLVFSFHGRILELLWGKPESLWILWLWHLTALLLALLLTGVASILGYLVSQILFNVLIMDAMSIATEKLIRGTLQAEPSLSLPVRLWFLVRQETPRAILPIAALLILMVLGWLTPLGPVLSVLAPCLAVVFLAWDNTDLTPARRLLPFKQRFSRLMKTFFFHLGFGLPFLIPIANALLLSFAPVGGTLFHLEHPIPAPPKGETL